MRRVEILGIRHHGPGSARAVAAALDEVAPDIVVIEGPPELDAIATLAASAAMVPPVAALTYVPDEPKLASFHPFAGFSPEWVALRWASSHNVAVRFADLPAAISLAARRAEAPPPAGPEGGEAGGRLLRQDPLGALAAAAGFDDPERWWEDAIEHRHHGLDAFAAVAEAMAELRLVAGSPLVAGDLREAQREASMRQAIRAATKAHERVVFVCGAWHVPAVMPDNHPPAKHDQDLLRGLPKVKVVATWVPWSNRRLGFASGYSAGVTAPGWYEHLYDTPSEVSASWLTRTAALLREERIDVSTAAVIEGVRLADALATLRGRPLAGLDELTDATQAVLCGGSAMPLSLVHARLHVGEAMGSVPLETPMVPLARDLERLQKRLRLKRTAAEQTAKLDLRTESHRERSHLLHRLRLLQVHWGVPVDIGATRGTFREAWKLVWEPELELALIDASGLGTTVEQAANVHVAQQAADAGIDELTNLVEDVLLAELPEARAAVMTALADRAARQHEVERLMAAIEPLARISRYGNVRRVDTEAVLAVLHGIAVRICIGLGSACASLDDDAAALMRDRIDGVQRGLAALDDRDLRAMWVDALSGLADQHGVHGSVAGRAVRLLFDAGRLGRDEVGRRLSRALSRGADAQAAAEWLDAFLSGDATLLLHDQTLLATIDRWITEVDASVFDDLLPLVRRTFSDFEVAERRMLAERVRRLDGSGGATARAVGGEVDDSFDAGRAALALPVLRQILGVGPDPGSAVDEVPAS